MKPRPPIKKTAAMTLTEVLVIITALVLLAAILLPALAAAKRKSSKVGCTSQLLQVGIIYRVWADDNGDKYPMQVSVTNGGVMELAITGNVPAIFCVMSNMLSEPKILICPSDTNHISATNFATLENSNISYFVGLDAVDTQPQTLLSGDDNLVVNGTNIQSGILNLHADDLLAWTKERHQGAGNVLSADGSVQQATGAGLTATAGLATNRLAIP